MHTCVGCRDTNIRHAPIFPLFNKGLLLHANGDRIADLVDGPGRRHVEAGSHDGRHHATQCGRCGGRGRRRRVSTACTLEHGAVEGPRSGTLTIGSDPADGHAAALASKHGLCVCIRVVLGRVRLRLGRRQVQRGQRHVRRSVLRQSGQCDMGGRHPARTSRGRRCKLSLGRREGIPHGAGGASGGCGRGRRRLLYIGHLLLLDRRGRRATGLIVAVLLAAKSQPSQ